MRQTLPRRIARRIGVLPKPLPYDTDTAWVMTLINQSSRFFDAGCNLGDLTVYACQDPRRQVVAADANADALSVAACRVFKAGASLQVRFALGFLSAEDGEEVEFFTVGVGSAGSRYKGHAVTAAKRNSSFMVPTLRLDSVCDVTGVMPDLVKIDVEGAETEVLRGATKAAASGAAFFVEMHSPPELPMVRNVDLVLKWCQANSYAAHYMKEHRLLTESASVAHRGRCHLLLLPGGTAYPDELRPIPQGANPAKFGL